MTQMTKLATLLAEATIPYQLVAQVGYGTPQIFVPNEDTQILDVVCNEISYGNKEGLLEIYDEKVEGETLGWLTAEKAFLHIKERWENLEVINDYDEPYYDECGFNPYMGCYDYDC